MGKSPGKWIKALLLGKKSSRSSTSKKYANDKGRKAKNELSPHGGGSPLISHPVPVTVISNHCADKKPQMESSSNLPSNGISGDSIKEEKGSTSFSELDHKNKIEEGQAAIKIQAAFRCYLARRAYRALWGITKLQALYRGHLVRRQAAVTLQSIRGLVKLQAIIRGRKARRSDGLEDAKTVDHLSTSLTCQATNLSSSRLVNKLLSSQQAPKPLKLQYAKNEPNSVWNWLERWSSIQFWKRESLQQKPIDVKAKARLGGYALETESGKIKHGPRKNFASENGSPLNTSESEKIKRSLRKANIPISETVQEQPQSELEKVKLNLRKITSLYTPAEGESDRSKRLAKNVTNLQADGPEQSHVNFSEKAKLDNMQPPEKKIDSMQFQETVQKQDIEIEANIETKQKAGLDTKMEEPTAEIQVHENVPIYLTNDDSISEESNVMLKDESHTPTNGYLNPNEASEETQKTSKRRASFPAKLESTENGLQNNPALPSYMAATKSAKAKTRGQISPRFSSEAIDKNGFAHRHSLPSSTNRKLGQRPDHPVRAEWRR